MPMTQGLKLGGVIFIECLTEEMISIHPEINREFLLRTGELQRWFFSGVTGKSLEIIDCYEGWRSPGSTHTRAVASLIARRVT